MKSGHRCYILYQPSPGLVQNYTSQIIEHLISVYSFSVVLALHGSTVQVRSTTACDSFDIERCRIETVSVSNIQLAIVRSAFCCTLSDL